MAEAAHPTNTLQDDQMEEGDVEEEVKEESKDPSKENVDKSAEGKGIFKFTKKMFDQIPESDHDNVDDYLEGDMQNENP